MIKAILFDLWNTLIYDKSKNLFNLMITLEEAGIENPNDIFDKCLCTRRFKDEEEASKELGKLISNNPDVISKVFDVLRNQKTAAFPDVMSNLDRLGKRYKLAIISNATQFGMSNAKKTGIFKKFDELFFSYKTGYMKQKPGFFTHVLKELGVKPEEAVMVGDIIYADIDPAEKIGMKGILTMMVSSTMAQP